MTDELEQRRKHNQMMRDRIVGIPAQEGPVEPDGVNAQCGNVEPQAAEDYWAKAYRLADELRRHLMTRPVN